MLNGVAGTSSNQVPMKSMDNCHEDHWAVDIVTTLTTGLRIANFARKRAPSTFLLIGEAQEKGTLFLLVRIGDQAAKFASMLAFDLRF